jgi:hypothetical protein
MFSNTIVTSYLNVLKVCSAVSRTGGKVLKLNITEFQYKREGPEGLLSPCQDRGSS